jgi:PAS domain S-box-containing protein
VLVAGLNPYRKLDEHFRNFIGLVAGQIANGMANAGAYEAELRRAEALAELDRAKTAFFSNISHEFRTPLTLMIAPLEELKAEFGRAASLFSVPQYHQLDLVHRNGLRLLKLVNTLLEFSRIEAGRVQAVYEGVDLTTLTSELASVFRSAVEKAGLHLIIDCPSLQEPAFVDREMCEKIVLNLVSNAFKFTFEGEIEVRLRQTDCQFELAIRDTGTGIPRDELPILFERFHRVAGARGRTHEGSGIGLALVQELARLHSGSVTVESVYGQGSTFRVRIPSGKSHLPPKQIGATRALSPTRIGARPFVEEAMSWLLDDQAADDAALSLDAALFSVVDGDRDRERILLADDNGDMREYLRRLLAQRYRVDAVADGQAALDHARTDPPDLVLADVMMPRLDGFGLLKRLRSGERTRTIPVFLLSARAGEESRVEGLRAGADDYLIKPFHARELLARIESCLKLAQVRREIGESQAHLAAIVASSDDAILSKTLEGIVTSWNAAAERMFGYTAQEMIGQSLRRIIPADRQHEEDVILARLAAGTRVDHFETVRVGKAGKPIEVSVTISPVKDSHGRIIGASKIVRDITERKDREQQVAMLIREVNHRSKNMLVTVQAIARQTAALGREDFVERFAQRIQALAASQDMLTKSGWKNVSLEDLVREQLAHFKGLLGKRIRLTGKSTNITATAAQALGMATHELATNASKYGALSTDAGRVEISWNIEATNGGQSRFSMSWSESGGPPVAAPTRRGFGSTVLDTLAKMSLTADVELNYAASGLVWRLSCAADKVLELGTAHIQHKRGGDDISRSMLVRPCILVVEDEALAALELAGDLEAAGFQVLGPAISVAQALTLINNQSRCDAAVLDVNLGRETSQPIALRLIASGIPFVTVSGYAPDQMPAVFRAAPLVTKPLQPGHLVQALNKCLNASAVARE